MAVGQKPYSQTASSITSIDTLHIDRELLQFEFVCPSKDPKCCITAEQIRCIKK